MCGRMRLGELRQSGVFGQQISNYCLLKSGFHCGTDINVSWCQETTDTKNGAGNRKYPTRVGSKPIWLFNFADPEHLGLAGGTNSPGCCFAVLHSDNLGTLHLLLDFTFDAIRFHSVPSFWIRAVYHSA